MSENRARRTPARGRLVTRTAAAIVSGLFLGLAAAPATASPEPTPADGQHLAINARMGLAASELVDLGASYEPGPGFDVVIPILGGEHMVSLWPKSIRGAGYQVFHSDAAGNLTEVEADAVNTYRGEVLGNDDSYAAMSIVGGQLYGRVFIGDDIFWVEPAPAGLAPAGRYVVYHDDDILPTGGLCGAEALGRAVDDFAAIDVRGKHAPQAAGLQCTELAADADFSYQNRWGNNTASRINSVIDQMNVQYERDVNITHEVVTIIIRTQQVYTTNDPEALLNQFRSRWNANHRGINRDIAHLFTGRNLNGGVIGIAWLSVICNNPTNGRGYGLVESDFSGNFACVTDLSAHELGHNWSAGHCSCSGFTMNPFITCANRFSGGSISSISNHRNSRNCLGVCEGIEPGRCCFEDGSCEVLSVSDCTQQGGVPGPEGSECDGSCPLPAPDNDGCIDAIAVGEETVQFDTSGTTDDGPNLPNDCDEGFGLSFVQDIWYSYQPTCNGTATASLCGSSYDTRLAVYVLSGACPGSFFACNDDACGAGGTRSEVSFIANPALTYWIRVGGFDSGGEGTLTMSCGDDPVCPEDFDGDGMVGFSDVVAVLSEWGPCEGECPWDLNDDGIVGFADLVQVLSVWGPCEG